MIHQQHLSKQHTFLQPLQSFLLMEQLIKHLKLTDSDAGRYATYAFACLDADAYSFPHAFAGWYRSLNAGSTVAETTCSG